MDKKEKIKKVNIIEQNLNEATGRFNAGEITQEQLNRMKADAHDRIYEITKEE